MRILAHALAPGKPVQTDNLWQVPLHVEYADGTTGIEEVLFAEEEDALALQKYFKNPKNFFSPIELEI